MNAQLDTRIAAIEAELASLRNRKLTLLQAQLKDAQAALGTGGTGRRLARGRGRRKS